MLSCIFAKGILFWEPESFLLIICSVPIFYLLSVHTFLTSIAWLCRLWFYWVGFSLQFLSFIFSIDVFGFAFLPAFIFSLFVIVFAPPSIFSSVLRFIFQSRVRNSNNVNSNKPMMLIGIYLCYSELKIQ